MDLYHVFIAHGNQGIALKMRGDVVRNLVLVEVLVPAVNQQLRVVTVCERIVLRVNAVNRFH